MTQDAYFFANTRSYPEVSGFQIVLQFRGFMFRFGTSYVALFNGLMISAIGNSCLLFIHLILKTREVSAIKVLHV